MPGAYRNRACKWIRRSASNAARLSASPSSTNTRKWPMAVSVSARSARSKMSGRTARKSLTTTANTTGRARCGQTGLLPGAPTRQHLLVATHAEEQGSDGWKATPSRGRRRFRFAMQFEAAGLKSRSNAGSAGRVAEFTVTTTTTHSHCQCAGFALGATTDGTRSTARRETGNTVRI